MAIGRAPVVLSTCVNQRRCYHEPRTEYSLPTTVHNDLITPFRDEFRLVNNLNRTLNYASRNPSRSARSSKSADKLCDSSAIRIDRIAKIGRYLLSVDGTTKDSKESVAIVLICFDLRRAMRQNDEINLMGPARQLVKPFKLTIPVYSDWCVQDSKY